MSKFTFCNWLKEKVGATDKQIASLSYNLQYITVTNLRKASINACVKQVNAKRKTRSYIKIPKKTNTCQNQNNLDESTITPNPIEQSLHDYNDISKLQTISDYSNKNELHTKKNIIPIRKMKSSRNVEIIKSNNSTINNKGNIISKANSEIINRNVQGRKRCRSKYTRESSSSSNESGEMKHISKMNKRNSKLCKSVNDKLPVVIFNEEIILSEDIILIVE